MNDDRRMKYQYLVAINLETGRRERVREEKLRFYLDNKSKFSFVCTCNPDEEIPMIIQRPANNQKDVAIFRTEHGDKRKHKSGCYYRNGVCTMESGMWLNKDGKFETEVEFGKKYKPVTPRTGGGGKGNPDVPRKREMKRGKQTFQAFCEMLMLKTWNLYYAKRYNESNYSLEVFLGEENPYESYLIGQLNNFVLNKMNVNSMLTTKALQKYYLNIGEAIMKDNNNFKGNESSFYYRVLNKNSERVISVDAGMLAEAKKRIQNIGYDKLMCFVILDQKNVVQDIAFVPCNRYWLYSESKCECSVYNLLIKDQYFFEKPEQRVDPIKYPFKADGIINKDSIHVKEEPIFTFSDKYNTILEIFGVQGKEDYDNRKDRKDTIGQSLNKSDSEWRYKSFDRDFLDKLKRLDI